MINRSFKAPLVILCAAIIVVAAGVILERSPTKKESRREITELMHAFALGQSMEDVRTIFKNVAGKHSKLLELSSSQWLVNTPPEFGAVNWYIWIDFASGKITALRVRLADGPEMKPPDAPSDKVAQPSVK